MTDFTLACIKANKEIKKYIDAKNDKELFRKHGVGEGGDVSLTIDLLSEKIFVDYLGSYGKIESEESGVIGEGESVIIIDPIDGSSNISSGFPYYGTSVAKINTDGVLDVAVVCNMATGDVFFKEEKGKLLQGKMYDMEFRTFLPTTNREIGLFERAYAHPELASELINMGYKFRSPGATALSLAYASSVNYFLFVGKSRIYDIVAGLALCQDLEVVVEDDYVIVSHSKEIVKNIEELVLRSLR